jgi:hypothetical protein
MLFPQYLYLTVLIRLVKRRKLPPGRENAERRSTSVPFLSGFPKSRFASDASNQERGIRSGVATGATAQCPAAMAGTFPATQSLPGISG